MIKALKELLSLKERNKKNICEDVLSDFSADLSKNNFINETNIKAEKIIDFICCEAEEAGCNTVSIYDVEGSKKYKLFNSPALNSHEEEFSGYITDNGWSFLSSYLDQKEIDVIELGKGLSIDRFKSFKIVNRVDRKNILFLEDDVFYSNVMASILVSKGYLVTKASSIEEARSLLTSDKNFDLFIADYYIKNKEVAPFINEIKNKENFINLPILALTSDVTEDIEIKCVKAGAITVISKRRDSSVIFAYMDKVLEND